MLEKELKKLQSINLDLEYQIQQLNEEIWSEKERSKRLINLNDELQATKNQKGKKDIDFQKRVLNEKNIKFDFYHEF